MSKKILALILWLVVFVIIRLFLLKIDSFEMICMFDDFQITKETIERGVNAVFVGVPVIMNGIPIFINTLKNFIDVLNKREEKMSRISIFIKDVSTIRSGLRYDDVPEVVIGDTKYFVYINANIKNIGENTIKRCTINDNDLAVGVLETQGCRNFCFRVCRCKDEKFENQYILKLKYIDDRNKCYYEELKLEIHEKEQEAEIFPYKSLRRCRK